MTTTRKRYYSVSSCRPSCSTRWLLHRDPIRGGRRRLSARNSPDVMAWPPTKTMSMLESCLSSSRVCSAVGCGGGDLGGCDSPPYLSRAAERSPEVDDTKRQAEVKKGVLSAEVLSRYLSLLEATLILFS